MLVDSEAGCSAFGSSELMSKPNESRETSSVPSSFTTGSEAAGSSAGDEPAAEESPSPKSTPKSLKSTLSVPSFEGAAGSDEEPSSLPKSTPLSKKNHQTSGNSNMIAVITKSKRKMFQTLLTYLDLELLLMMRT